MIEGVLLTGGASRRMGADKARLMVDGEPLAERIARSLAEHCSRVTVLGREPLDGCDFLEDQEEFAGPLIALSRFAPTADAVFVVSCDLPRFDGRLVPFLDSLRDGWQAVVPQADAHLQPLCAVYSAEAWTHLNHTVEEGKRSLMAWLERLRYRTVDPEEIADAGIDPLAIRGANSPEEWARLRAT